MKADRAEFKLTDEPALEEKVFVRAQAILDAWNSGAIKELTVEETRMLRILVARHKRWLTQHPNSEVEIGPTLARALEGLEAL